MKNSFQIKSLRKLKKTPTQIQVQQDVIRTDKKQLTLNFGSASPQRKLPFIIQTSQEKNLNMKEQKTPCSLRNINISPNLQTKKYIQMTPSSKNQILKSDSPAFCQNSGVSKEFFQAEKKNEQLNLEKIKLEKQGENFKLQKNLSQKLFDDSSFINFQMKSEQNIKKPQDILFQINSSQAIKSKIYEKIDTTRRKNHQKNQTETQSNIQAILKGTPINFKSQVKVNLQNQQPIKIQLKNQYSNLLRKTSIEQINSQESVTSVTEVSNQSDIISDTGESVVWKNEDFLNQRIFHEISDKKDIEKFMELYKFRYESYPNMKDPISNEKVLRTAIIIAKMNKKSYKKYLRKQDVRFENQQDYTKGYDPTLDENLQRFVKYCNERKNGQNCFVEGRNLQSSKEHKIESINQHCKTMINSIFKMKY